MGYGYRSMKPEELKGYAMEVTFDPTGCELTLYSGDAWHFAKYKLTFAELLDWKTSGKYPKDIAWIRAEYVQRVIKDHARAECMPEWGPRNWCSTGSPMQDPAAISLHTFLSKWQVK
jgi:hypothetical protein